MSRAVYYPNLWFDDELAGHPQHLSSSVRQTILPIGLAVPLLNHLEPASQEPTESPVFCLTPDLPEGLPAALQHVTYITEQSFSRDPTSDTLLSPWGWSESALRTAHRLGLHPAWVPQPDAVRLVNSRRFAVECSRAGFSEDFPPDSQICHSVRDVEAALTELARSGCRRWWIKTEFSGAGRHRRTGSTPRLRDPDRSWLQRHLSDGSIVVVEPCRDVVSECGLQFWIADANSTAAPDGRQAFECSLQGVTELLTTRSGQFLGSLAAPDNTLRNRWGTAILRGFGIAERAAELGYRGPLGLDCMTFHDAAGALRLRVGHDINGRQTMGRLALACRSHAAPGTWLSWIVVSAAKAAALEKSVRESASSDVDFIPTSPERIAGKRVTTCTAAIAGTNLTDLLRLLRSHCEFRQKLPMGN